MIAMERLPPVSGSGINPDASTKRYDYSLSPDTPVYPNSNFYPEEQALEIDVHEGMEVGVVLSGAQERHFDGLVFRVAPGDVWMCTAWETHGWRTTEPGTRDMVLIFRPEFLGDETLCQFSWLSLFAAPPGQRPRVTTPEVRAAVLGLGREVLKEFEQRRRGWEAAMRLDLLRLLLTLSREWRPPAHSNGQSRVSVGNLPRVMPALVLVHSRLSRRVTVAEAARSCGLSRAHFCELFRNTMGTSFGKFCLRARAGAAAKLLLSTELSTESIAERAGFTDGSHLHRTFVKQYGWTPARYREQHR